ncbi:MAG: hypothetical protein V4658_10880 [Bacteroidota bacterium]
MTDSEVNMISGCIDGKRSSQKMLYDRFASKMLGVCMQQHAGSVLKMMLCAHTPDHNAPHRQTPSTVTACHAVLH